MSCVKVIRAEYRYRLGKVQYDAASFGTLYSLQTKNPRPEISVNNRPKPVLRILRCFFLCVHS
jgi:hypothetical protein